MLECCGVSSLMTSLTSATLVHAFRLILGFWGRMPRRQRLKHAVISLCLSLALLVLPAAYATPKWWEKGWPRKRVGSVAEAELLSQLAVILMPDSEIQELFRSFPSPEGWGGHALEPDLTAHGILKEKDAALFVEYDGFWKHQEKKGIAMDTKKNAALLAYAPKGSYVVRISPTKRKPLKGNVLWVKADTWRQGHMASLLDVLKEVVMQISTGLANVLRPIYVKQFQGLMKPWTLSESGCQFAELAAARLGGNTSDEVVSFLKEDGFTPADIKLLNVDTWSRGQRIEQKFKPTVQWLLELGLTKSQVATAVAKFPQILGCSIEDNLKPTVQWLLELGLTKSQVATAVAKSPPTLGYSIEDNLKPTVQWLLELGLTKSQVAMAAAKFPSILGCSIEDNLKPTVQWLLELGLTKSQVATAVAKFPPILGYSIEDNLKPTVQWLLELGLTKSQVATAVAKSPPTLGYSIEDNLKPTVQWLLELGLTKSQVAMAAAKFPSILGCSIEDNLKPTVQWLLELGLTKSQVATAVAKLPQILGYSIEDNLKPTVQWLLELGLTKSQVATAVAKFPPILGYSIEDNLKPTVQWLLELGLTKSQVATAVAKSPPILGYSIEDNLKPTVQWLLGLGLTKSQVATAVAKLPQILGCSIEDNLKPTVQWLSQELSLNDKQLAAALASFPQVMALSLEQNLRPKIKLIRLFVGHDVAKEQVASNLRLFSYRYERLKERLKILVLRNKTSQLAGAMTLSDENFAKRYN